MTTPEKNWLEWAVFGVSLALVMGTLAYLAYDALTLGDTPPRIEVRLGAPERAAGHFIVPVAVTNRGDQTAEGVHIEVVLERGAREEERSDFEIAFLPRGSTREGWVVFQSDPAAADATTARVLGYEKP
jgi:uncharacterized protein (TIGR02588 family)